MSGVGWRSGSRRLMGGMWMLGAVATVMAQADVPNAGNDMGSVIRSLSVASPYRLSELARSGTIRYWIRIDGLPAATLPETGEQHVERDGEQLRVTVCAKHCGAEAAPSATELIRAKHANAWLQSDDATIVKFARGAAGSVEAQMRRLALAVRQRLDRGIEYRRYLSALDAHDARVGDCTEYALLLAAAARSRGIPARVVAGLAYSSRFSGSLHHFGPHMWVQVWDGVRWVSHDAALGSFDAGRIALAVGDGSPESLRGVTALIKRIRIGRAAAVQHAAPEPATPR